MLDIIFVIYIYQRWIYRVDKKRTVKFLNRLKAILNKMIKLKLKKKINRINRNRKLIDVKNI